MDAEMMEVKEERDNGGEGPGMQSPLGADEQGGNRCVSLEISRRTGVSLSVGVITKCLIFTQAR